MDAALVQDIAVQALNLSLMFSVGLDLDLAEVRVSLRRRGLLLVVVLLNFGMLPLVAIGATWATPLPAGVAAGVLLAAFAPGGGTGTLLTRTARGNLELSVVLLVLLTLLAVPLTPALTLATVAAPDGSRLDPGPLVRTLLLFQLVPLLCGVGARLASSRLADLLAAIARPVSNVIFAALVIGLTITHIALVPNIGVVAIGIITLLVATSLAVPTLLPGTRRDRAAVALTTGVRNLALSLLLASTFFDDVTTLTVLVYGLVMYLIGVPAALWARRTRPA